MPALLGLQMAAFLSCVHMVGRESFGEVVGRERGVGGREESEQALFLEDCSPIGLGIHPYDFISPLLPPKTPS